MRSAIQSSMVQHPTRNGAYMTDRMPNAFSGHEPDEPAGSATGSMTGSMTPADKIEAATRRLAAALDAMESAVERRREYDRGSDELAARIQALGIDRSRLANELDGTLVRSRELERTNREIAERLDVAIGTIRSVIEEDAS